MHISAPPHPEPYRRIAELEHELCDARAARASAVERIHELVAERDQALLERNVLIVALLAGSVA